MNAFITGSHAYGTPDEDSDVDLVVLVQSGANTDEKLRELADDPYSTPVMYGDLNLIICTDPVQFTVWHAATIYMARNKKNHGPYDKDQAKKVLDQYRKRAGICDQSDSGE